MTNKEAIDELVSLQLHCKSFMEHKHHDPWESDIKALDLAIKALEERPQGEWITDERGYVCSECGALHSDDYPFCHMCGADMRGTDK